MKEVIEFLKRNGFEYVPCLVGGSLQMDVLNKASASEYNVYIDTENGETLVEAHEGEIELNQLVDTIDEAKRMITFFFPNHQIVE